MERLILLPGPSRPAGVPDLIRCRFNPESLETRHDAGHVARPAPLFGAWPAPAAAAPLNDAAPARADLDGGLAAGDVAPSGARVGFGGSGWTTLALRLLFESEPDEAALGDRPGDVRAQTEPLRRLARPVGPMWAPPCPVTLVWGRAWSFRGAVSRLSETVDRVTVAGVAQRAWVAVEFVAIDAPVTVGGRL